MNTFGVNLKAARFAKGLKQGELASLVGAKEGNNVSNWECGVSRPDSDTIIKLCSVLGVSANILLDIKVDAFSLSIEEVEHIKNTVPLTYHMEER